MKWQKKQLLIALDKTPEELPPLVFIYGEDGGAVSELSQKLSKHINPDQNDPFCVDKIGVESIVSERSLIADSANTPSLIGGVKLVKVEGVNGDISAAHLNAVTEAVKNALEHDYQSSVVVISGAGIDAKSAIAKLVEKDKKAVAVRCFHDSARDIGEVVHSFFRERGKIVQPEAQIFLKDNLGNDRSVTMQELEKLDLYVGDAEFVTIDDCLESIASAPSVNSFKLCDAIASRDSATVDLMLSLLQQEGEDLNSVANLVAWHLRRLQQAKDLIEQGKSADQAMAALRPPVMFNKPQFKAQLNKYPKVRLDQLGERLYKLQLESRQGAIAPQLVAHRALLSLGV